MTPLIISLLALLAAPLLCWYCGKRPELTRLMDGFIFVAIGGLILTSVLPEAVRHGGWATIFFLLLGLVLPVLSERILHQVGDVHRTAVLLGLSGLFLHAITDGAALSGDLSHDDGMLGIAVLLHRLPIGLTLWWLTYPQFGALVASALLGIIALGTGLGFAYAPEILQPLSTQSVAWFQAFVTGTLVHVLYHQPHAPQEDCCASQKKGEWYEGFGNLLGGLLVVYLVFLHGGIDTSGWLGKAAHSLLELSLASAPALLLAYLIAGLALAFLPQSYVNWMRRGRPWQQSLRGVAVGLPLPVCSCGVVPLYHTLIKKGAPPAAAIAFLIATPELGIDAVLLSLPLLGGEMTLVRVIAAALVALAVGIFIGKLLSQSEPCAVHGALEAEDERNWREKLNQGLRQGTGELVDHTGPWIVAGLVVAALAQPLLSGGLFDVIPAGLEVPFFALLGMPVYICAAGATPLVAVFLFSGISPGAALAFLITGPATNITTLGVLSGLHGRKVALLFAASTLVITVALGYLTNSLLSDFEPIAIGDNEHGASLLEKASLCALIGLYLFSILRRGARAFVMELFTPSMMGNNDGGHSHAHA